MGENSKIEWTNHTFNPWIGCVRVSPACEHCYAEAMANHYRWAKWGTEAAGGTRHVTSAANWRKPIAWNREAHRHGTRERVFCASLADVFEDFRGLDEHRARLWKLIEMTPYLDWLLLTKRPQNIGGMIPASWTRTMPAQVWLGTTVEDQQRADQRIPELIKHPASVRFLSVEPQLGPVDLSRYIGDLDWVIAGGESGPGSRPTQVAWARSIRDQVTGASKTFFFKQWGNHMQIDSTAQLVRIRTKNERLLDGLRWSEIPTPNSRGDRLIRAREGKGPCRCGDPECSCRCDDASDRCAECGTCLDCHDEYRSRLDAMAKQLSEPGEPATRATVVRKIGRRRLEVLEAEHPEGERKKGG